VYTGVTVERRSPRGAFGRGLDVELDIGTFREAFATDVLHVEEHVLVVKIAVVCRNETVASAVEEPIPTDNRTNTRPRRRTPFAGRAVERRITRASCVRSSISMNHRYASGAVQSYACVSFASFVTAVPGVESSLR